ncbi:MAG: glycosyltransferase family 39 protein [Chitinophagales bacterium]|nr:glycosyltransferase family 39 protein [Chitinophagales bacterium]
MTLPKYLINKIPLGIILLVFVFFKLQDISLPYFWDELGVYAPGALKMIDNQSIGVLPINLEPEYSRGHPLFFVFSQAVWMNIFGQSVVSGHSFSILLGVLTLIATYFTSNNLFDKRTALFATTLLAVQPIFYALAGLILPEMMLALFVLLSVWAIIRQRWFLFFILSSVAIMIKESAIVLPALAAMVVFADAFKSEKFFSLQNTIKMFFALGSLLVFGIFLLIQKEQNGWYFFPLHINLMEHSAINTYYKVKQICDEVFYRQGRIYLSLLLFILPVFFYLKNRNFSNIEKRSYFIVGLFFLLCLAFAALNFYLMRYMLLMIPLIVIMAVHELIKVSDWLGNRKKWLLIAAPASIGIAIAAIYTMDSTKNGGYLGDADMSYKHVIMVEQQAISWVEQQPWATEKIGANFPIFQGIRDVRNGYLSKHPIIYSENAIDTVKYGVFFQLFPNDAYLFVDRKHKIIKEFTGVVGSVKVLEFEKTNS